MRLLIRLRNVNSKVGRFLEDNQLLCSKLFKQGFNPAALRKLVLKFHY